ncbi:MAG: hypothetical protein Q8P02_04045 [Candidatus Micrarchaeota archaeon]|nr:hypothetical protein [Candidatus Micrarchaeota archaeon]
MDILSVMRDNHAFLTKNGFSSQFLGSMVEYRLRKKPEVSVAFQIKEHPYRKPHAHGFLLYRLLNSSFLQTDEVREEAQAVVWAMKEKQMVLEAGFDFAALKPALAPATFASLKKTFSSHGPTREAFKNLLNDVHGHLAGAKASDNPHALAPKK